LREMRSDCRYVWLLFLAPLILAAHPPLLFAFLLCFFVFILVRPALLAFSAPGAARPAARRVLCVLGSGGHTTEMLALLRALPTARYAPRTYVVAATDATSVPRAVAAGALPADGSARVIAIPRAREVGQGFVGAAWFTARGLLASVGVLLAEQPRLLLVNGPGTCVPVCAAAVLLRAAGALPADAAVVFVESACRVTSLSLSGRLALRWGLADVVAVQWEQLARAVPGTVFVGLQV
jgi:beta-1,4-N-acetylglucosaminyltransferase